MSDDPPARFAVRTLQLAIAALVIVLVAVLVLWVINTPLVVDWSWNGWTGISAIATLALAVVTAVMAIATGYLARKSRSEASAARDTVTEIQRDRELTFRPYVTWKLGGPPRPALLGMMPLAAEGTFVNGVNLGKGPALNTVFCLVENDEKTWSASPAPMLVDFSPGMKIRNRHEIGMVPATGLPPPRPQVGQLMPRRVAFCEDQLGNRYRFVRGHVIADLWRPGEAKPDWVTWYEAHAKIAVRA